MKQLLISSSFLTIITMVINFLFKIYLSYHIDKEEIGTFYTFMDLVTIGIMVLSGFKDSLIRAYDRANFQYVFYWYIVVFWGLFGFVLVGGSIYYSMIHFSYPLYYFIVLLLVNSVMIFVSYLNAAYKNYHVMLFENIVSALTLVLSYLVLSSFLDAISSLFCAFVAAFLGRATYILYRARFNFKLIPNNISNSTFFLKDTLFSGLMYFFSGFFISMSGVVLMKLFGSADILAEYQVVVRSIFFSLVAVFVFPLNTYTFPQISKLVTQKKIFEIQIIDKKLKKYLILFFLLLLVGTFFTKFVIALIFPQAYMQSYKMLNILLPVLPLLAYTTFAINIIKGYDRFDLALYVRVLGSILFFVSIYLFYFLGFTGVSVVFSLDISFMGMFILAYIYKQRLMA